MCIYGRVYLLLAYTAGGEWAGNFTKLPPLLGSGAQRQNTEMLRQGAGISRSDRAAFAELEFRALRHQAGRIIRARLLEERDATRRQTDLNLATKQRQQ